MLLLGALFAFLVAGFWLYCLADVALTPSNECHRLPKAAWIAIVAGTFVIGAVVWLAVRRPAQPTVASLSPAPWPDPGGTPGRGGSAPAFRASGSGGAGRPGEPGAAGGARTVDRAGQDSARPQEQRDMGRPGNETFTGQETVSQASPHSPMSPTGVAGLISAVGPDDDPAFLRSLDRAIHGAEAGDDPAAG